MTDNEKQGKENYQNQLENYLQNPNLCISFDLYIPVFVKKEEGEWGQKWRQKERQHNWEGSERQREIKDEMGRGKENLEGKYRERVKEGSF